MEIHVLTQDPVSRERLTALLAEMETTCILHDEVEPLLRAVKKLKKSDIVLYDLSLEDRLWAFERLNSSCRRTNLVGFEQLTRETSEGGQHCVDGMGHYLLLPQNLDRAKARMQEVLRGVAREAASKKRKPKSRRKAQATRASVAPSQTAVAATPERGAATGTPAARYLQAQSAAMQNFLSQLNRAVVATQPILIHGEDGAEFELVARELNYHANGDISPLLMLDPMRVDFEELRDFESQAAGEQQVHYCYVGLSSELNRRSANALIECLQYLRSMERPHLRLVIGHVIDSESYLCETTGPMVRDLREQAASLELPALAQRTEDVPLIVQRIFSSLRMAHPFLRARTLSKCAVHYLQSECADFDYDRLVRVLRNAMALGESETLSEKELKHLDDNSPTTQHLIESLADEKYFPVESSGVA